MFRSLFISALVAMSASAAHASCAACTLPSVTDNGFKESDAALAYAQGRMPLITELLNVRWQLAASVASKSVKSAHSIEDKNPADTTIVMQIAQTTSPFQTLDKYIATPNVNGYGSDDRNPHTLMSNPGERGLVFAYEASGTDAGATYNQNCRMVNGTTKALICAITYCKPGVGNKQDADNGKIIGYYAYTTQN